VVTVSNMDVPVAAMLSDRTSRRDNERHTDQREYRKLLEHLGILLRPHDVLRALAGKLPRAFSTAGLMNYTRCNRHHSTCSDPRTLFVVPVFLHFLTADVFCPARLGARIRNTGTRPATP
jgi:hypothetical protein